MENEDDRHTEEVPIKSITNMPIYLYVAEFDKLCQKEQALWISETIGEAIREVRIFEE